MSEQCQTMLKQDTSRRSHALFRGRKTTIPTAQGSSSSASSSFCSMAPSHLKKPARPPGWVVKQLSRAKADTKAIMPAKAPKMSKVTNGNKPRGADPMIVETAEPVVPLAREDPPLSAEQQRVVDIVIKKRCNVFFTGSAGTGKSVLLRAIIQQLTEIYGGGVAVTASTGIAACNINGCTIHSFAGIGLGDKTAETLIQDIQARPDVVQRWRTTQCLVVDEISMIDGLLLDKIETVARSIRANPAPFGGIQVVFTGDFFQLPPVSRNRYFNYAFEAKCWLHVIDQAIVLKQVFRQRDQKFVNILNELRLGKLSMESQRILSSLDRPPASESAIEPTELFAIRDEVRAANETRLAALPGRIHVFKAIDQGERDKIAPCLAPEILQLKKHAQVMLLRNMDRQLVNGSLGIVVGFTGEDEYADPSVLGQILGQWGMAATNRPGFPIVQFSNGRKQAIYPEKWSLEMGHQEIASRTQLPLMLAWAWSIHKSQGQTLDQVRVDLGKVFESGQAYVALSRATSLRGLQILNFDPKKVMVNQKVVKFYQQF